MHIPVLLCGLLCGPVCGALAGIATPALSCFFTQMPSLYPMLPIMAVQLTAMGFVGGFLRKKLRAPLYVALLAAAVCGWVMYGLGFASLMLASGGTLKILSVTGALTQGLPGMAVQLTLIPALVAAVERYRRAGSAEAPSPELISEARRLIKSGEVSCVVIREGAIIHTADGRGVKPLLELYNNEPEKLKDSCVVDKIIGKAAAMILILGGSASVFGEVMSVSARDYLTKRGIRHNFGRCVDVITARDKTGICPIEKSVLTVDDPKEGIVNITQTVNRLMRRVI
jgi:hypothetical protein